MPFPPPPETNDRTDWGCWLTRVLMAFYLQSPGQTGWFEAEERLVRGVEATGWLRDQKRANLCEEVCGSLIPRWRAGQLYHLNHAFFWQERDKVTKAEQRSTERHGRVTVRYTDKTDHRAEATPPAPADADDRIHARVRVAVGEVRAELLGSYHDPEVGRRRATLYDLYLAAPDEAADGDLMTVLNARLAAGGAAVVTRATVSKYLTVIRRRLFERILAHLEPDEERVLFDHAAPEGALEHSRRLALDRLVRKAMGGGPDKVPNEPAPARPAAPAPHLLRQWWGDWPTDPRRQRWDAVFALYNPSGHLSDGPVEPPGVQTRPSEAERDRVLDDMAAHLEGWHFYRRAGEGWRRKLDGTARTFPAADPIWQVVHRAAGPVDGVTDGAERVRILDGQLVARPVSFAELPQYLGLSQEDLLVLLRAFRERSRPRAL